jgi:CheY-like chemotaxis protein
LAEDLPELHADAHQLGQVIINLVSNAHHAVRGAETRRIIVTTRHEAAPGFVSLTVEDTGPGIPPDIERRMFEPFFTTKPLGQGTGLGLPLCRGIVEDHGGALRVDGRPGRGARFVVELPVQPAAGPASGPAPLGAPAPIPPCRILVVDDEPEVASLVAEVLVDDHHTVETVTSGRAALERLDARAYDVIVSDIRMPDLDGIAFCRVLEQHQPAAGARLIFLTGDTLDPALGEFLRRSGHPYVAKPFTPEQLRRAMAQVLAPGLAGAREGLGAAPPPPSR